MVGLAFQGHADKGISRADNCGSKNVARPRARSKTNKGRIPSDESEVI